MSNQRLLNWKVLNTPQQIAEIIEISAKIPCAIFKHSTQCSISIMAKMRLENGWDFSAQELIPYYLDILSYRSLSNQIAAQFSTPHESPQLLLIRHGECTYDAAQFDISLAELHDCYNDTF